MTAISRASESSVVVRIARRLTGGSSIVRVLAVAGRPFRALDAAFARASREKAERIDEERVTMVVRESRIVRAADQLMSAPARAWTDARVRRLVDPVRHAVAAMTVSERVQLLGWMLTVAVVTRAALYVVTTGRPTLTTTAIWASLAAAGVLMMALRERIAVGWQAWLRRER
jgi:hypothetical protein